MSKIEEKYGLKTGQAIALFIILILNVLWIICSTITRIKMFGSLPLPQIVNIVMFAVTVYYVCYSYKKPHGNHMRYLMLCCAALEAIQYINTSFTYPTYIIYVFYAITILKAYMAGRLDHYKQNVIISAVILIGECLIRYALINIVISDGLQITFISFVRLMGPVTMWLAIAASYIIRYKPHKEAGLADKN